MKVALYARVSKALEQTPENQLIELRRWAASAGHEVAGEFVDETSSRDTRPEKEKVLRMLRLGEIEAVAFWSLDRWGRNITELVFELEEFSKLGKGLISMKEGLDLSSAAGRLMANMLAVMANFERDRISERSKLGVDRAKAWGKIRGRHPVDCGCGTLDRKGKKHEGENKPIRNESNVVVGWSLPFKTAKQTPPENTPPVQEVASIENQSGGYSNKEEEVYSKTPEEI